MTIASSSAPESAPSQKPGPNEQERTVGFIGFDFEFSAQARQYELLNKSNRVTSTPNLGL